MDPMTDEEIREALAILGIGALTHNTAILLFEEKIRNLEARLEKLEKPDKKPYKESLN